ncbi:MAG: rod shape-determining protein [Clostridium sp.]
MAIKFDEAIIGKIKKDKSFVIGEKTAEQIKITIGSAYADRMNLWTYAAAIW